MTSNLTVTVTYAADYVANLGSNNFQTLEEALAAAVAGDKVILLRDYTQSKTLLYQKMSS
ncbi:hypothetical protein [Candidatus Methanomassiliicoccus intestinalis]|uniref:hypothetical protein n=1 Tax=Candidatus Methanomassiliicoccus intestinalis TaxID=1406512 RepID=UPI0037DC354A